MSAKLPKMSSNKPHFVDQLKQVAQRVRRQSTGMTVRQLAADRFPVALSTLKAFDGGRHIRPPQLRQILDHLRVPPLDRIEVIIRFVEAYLREYLVPPVGARIDAQPNNDLVAEFRAMRHSRMPTHQEDLTAYFARRLKAHVHLALVRSEETLAAIASPTKGRTRKKDMFSVRSATVRKLQAGQCPRPEKFGAIRRQLHLPEEVNCRLKVAYAEAYVGEHLLGNGSADFNGIDRLAHPRTVSLLIFSTRDPENFA